MSIETIEQWISSHKEIVIGGLAVATVALIYYSQQNSIIPGPGALTDIPANQTAGETGYAPGNSPGYTGYNQQPIVPDYYPAQIAEANAPAGNGCCCSGGTPSCWTGSPLDTGSTFSTTSQLFNYLRDTNPFYVQLVAEQNQRYAALFATGSSYNNTSIPQVTGFSGLAGSL